MATEADRVSETRSLLRSLEKSRRTLRMYGAGNALCEQMEGELAAAASRFLDAFGACELEVRQDGIWLGGEVAFAAEAGSQGLPFLLFRDGVRALSLLPGLDRAQLHAFLEVLNQVSVATNDDDLVTLLWERDLASIRTLVVEDLEQDGSAAPEPDEEAEEQEPLPIAGGERVSIEDLHQPVEQLPVAECHLGEEEVARLQAELEAEEREDYLRSVVELAVELTLLGPDEEEWRATVDTLVTVLEGAVNDGSLERAGEALGLLVGLAEASPDAPAAGRLAAEVVAAATTPERVGAALNAVTRARDRVPPAALGTYLAWLGPAVVPALLPWVSQLVDAELRRVVATVVVLAGGATAVQALLDRLPAAPAQRAAILAEMLQATKQKEGTLALPVVRRALADPDPAIRRQAATTLGPFLDGPIGDLWVELLADHDPELRRLALTALVRTGRPELAQPVAELTMTPEFAERPLEEKQRCFQAVARLGGERCLPWFETLLRQPLKGWFTSRETRNTLTAVAIGLAAVRTAAGRRLLREMARSGDRPVRAACRDALKRGGPDGA